MAQDQAFPLPGVHPSPNIQSFPTEYEVENRAADPDRRIEATMESIAPWDGKVVLDLGAGTGFHIERFHSTAAHVIAVEPHDESRLIAMRRVADLGLTRTSITTGSAERIPLPDNSVDIVHSRFAYFFPPNCEPGLTELERIIHPGGTAFIIDNDLSAGEFATWLRRVPSFAEIDPVRIESFWADHGFDLVRIASEWRFESREDLESVVKIEFPEDVAADILAEHTGNTVTYHYCLYYRSY